MSHAHRTIMEWYKFYLRFGNRAPIHVRIKVCTRSRALLFVYVCASDVHECVCVRVYRVSWLTTATRLRMRDTSKYRAGASETMRVCVFQFLFRYFHSVRNILNTHSVFRLFESILIRNFWWPLSLRMHIHRLTLYEWHFRFLFLFSLHSTIHEEYQILLNWIVFCWHCWRYRPSEKIWEICRHLTEIRNHSEWMNETESTRSASLSAHTVYRIFFYY